MGYFDYIKNTQILSLERPCKYSGNEILNKSQIKLKALVEKEVNDKLTKEEEELKKWLGRLENVIHRENFYVCSIQEAVDIGLIV